MRTRTYVTKVLTVLRRALPALASIAILLAPTSAISAAVLRAPRDKSDSAAAQTATAPEPGGAPANSLYVQLGNVGLDPTRIFKVRGSTLDRAAIHITLEDGTIAFTKDVMGHLTGAFFEGYGEVLLAPPTDVERRSMTLFTGMAILAERFQTAYFRFNDNSAAELQSGLRAPEDAEAFVKRWDDTARDLAQIDAMRLLATFAEKLPRASGAIGESDAKAVDPDDRMLHIRLQGEKLGIFDLFFDSTAGEQVGAGQSKTAENGNVYYDVWTSFSTEEGGRRPRVTQKEVSSTLPSETQSREEPVLVRRYVIDAHVRPPKGLDADVDMQLEVVHGGSRFMAFELSGSLQIKSVLADGKPVEFIHNPPVEGTRLARSGNDLVAVILPEPTRKGQKIDLHFVYGGDVLAEAGNGLLYVGDRGTWYPNRGLGMTDFDLTFHYPAGWTLLATGKPTPVSSPQAGGAEQVSHWVSERPLPVAGFDLGKYVRAGARAGNVTVETYATAGVERDFPQAPAPSIQAESNLPSLKNQQSSTPAPPPSLPPAPSPARHAAAVAEIAAGAVQYYSERFGPFPYSQLALTQLPGRESQGFPGLIFLSSFAFLTHDEEDSIHMNPTVALMNQLVPAHETAHQWWGDLVAWSTYRDQWFSEGLANYCALMMLEEKDSASFRMVMEKYRRQLAEKNKDGNYPKDAGPVTLGARLLSSHFPEGYEAISYGRGAWLFHMLRTMMKDAAEEKAERNGGHGVDDPFMRSLRKVRERYEGKAITTRELLNVFAENLPPSLRYEGKTSLDWFMDSWINGTSLPRLELSGVKLTPKEKAILVTGIIRQKDTPEDFVTSVPVYAVVKGKAAPTYVGRVFADSAETTFRLIAPLGTHKILLDPNETVLTAPK